jgi:hypothetical protein
MSYKPFKIRIMKITSIEYFNTRRGVGYTCKTNVEGLTVNNDGDGGPTFLRGRYRGNEDYFKLTEIQLENLIDSYEGI